MTENAPPPTTTAAAPSADPTRGLPYYEKLKRDLRETLQKKRLLDKDMATLEDQIFRFEASYLEETAAGNIIKGFDNYIKGSSAPGATTSTSINPGGGGGGGGGGTSTRRKGTVMEQDRVFSRSSASFMRELSPTSSTQTTPSHAPTPTSSQPPQLRGGEGNGATPVGAGGSMKGAAQTKKNKKGEEEEGKGPKRLKITYARGGAGE